VSAQSAPHWFTVTHKDGTPAHFLGCPILVRNQAERTMFCERMKVDPNFCDMREATPAEISAGQIAADYCKPASAYELPPEVVASLRRRDSYNAFVVKLEHDGVQHVGSEVPTSEAEAAALDALIAELDSLLARCYELQRYEPKEDEDE
jgi:phosphoribosylaminoimidazole-succinocarboxamide synthase